MKVFRSQSSNIQLQRKTCLLGRCVLLKAAVVGFLAGTTAIATGGSASASLLFSVEEGGPSGLLGNGIYEAPAPSLAGVLGDIEVDGFSFDSNDIDEFFRLCFSVDELSQGMVGTHVRDEADLNEQEGDAFLSRGEYSRGGFVSGGPGHDQVIDESELGLVPGDDVDGAAAGDFGSESIYFTQAGSSAVFFQNASNTFASTAALDLLSGDDVDALVVWDDNNNGVFDGTDQALFSLARGSQTLTNGGFSAADVFSVTAGGTLSLFASHADLGLEFTDNLDALELVASGDTGKGVPEPTAAFGVLSIGLLGLLKRRKQ